MIKRVAGWPTGAKATALAVAMLGALGGVTLAESLTSGEVGPSLQLTGNGRQLHPVGRLTTVGDFPTGSALVPGGQFVWVADCGHGSNDVKVLNVASGAVVQTLPLPGCYGGVAVTPDGHHAYVSGTPKGSSPTEGPTKGDGGDVVHVFDVDPTTGQGVEQTPIQLPATSNGSGQRNSLPPASGTGSGQPEGLAVSGDGHWLVVAMNAADKAVVVDLSSGGQTAVSVGAYPNSAAFDPQGRAYVSNEYDGTVSVIDPATAKVTSTIQGFGGSLGDPGSHPEGMVADPKRHLLYVAVTDRDAIAVVDTDKAAITHTVSVARGDTLGTAPVNLAITPDGATLYAADSGEDALAAVSLAARPEGTPVAAGGSSTQRLRAVYAAPSLSVIRKYESARRALARRYRGRTGAAGYRRANAALQRRYLSARTVQACGGPTSSQERRYVSAVLAALRGPSRTRSRALSRASSALPRVARCASAHRVYAPPSLRAITTYSAAQTRLARRYRGRTRTAAYRRAVASLQRRYLRVTSQQACGGPTQLQERRYVNAVLAALRGARGARARALARARQALPRVTACRGSGTTPAGTGPIAGLPAYTLIGRIATAAYPDDVQVTQQGTLIWVAGKGFGAGPNQTYTFDGAKTQFQTPSTSYGTYVLDMLLGRVGTLPAPSDLEIHAMTAAADAQVRPSDPSTQPAGSPVPAATGKPSTQIKHVFYIVRENRTYDQVFGSDPRGDGERGLELFDDNGVSGPTGGITPNAHALVRRFPLLDHFYEDSEVSVDGHIITAGAYSNDYVQKATAANYSNRRPTFDFGIYPVTDPPKYYLFDQAAAQGVSFRDYGEAVGASPTDNSSNRAQYSKVASSFDTSYPNNLFIGCLQAGVNSSCTQDSGVYSGTGKPFAPQSRFDTWYPQFQQQVAAGTVPALNYMILPNDHTNGTKPGVYTPQAMIADNDLALGQIVDAISHSSIWPSTAIFVVEDDSQDGADHVDAHRSPAFVISPWAKPGAVVHTRYDQYSVLRTVELLTGIQPLALTDALATPMYDAFISGAQKPNNAPYSVVQPGYDIATMNSASSASAALSRRLPFSQMDQVPQALSDQILWKAVHGERSRPPAAGPNASPDGLAWAAVVRQLLRERKPPLPSSGPGKRPRCPITWACRPTPPGDG